MHKLIILGAGTAGTIMANKMRKELPGHEWSITIVEHVSRIQTVGEFYERAGGEGSQIIFT
jgi:NADH dehydrogenase FAD-containing subunit